MTPRVFIQNLQRRLLTLSQKEITANKIFFENTYLQNNWYELLKINKIYPKIAGEFFVSRHLLGEINHLFHLKSHLFHLTSHLFHLTSDLFHLTRHLFHLTHDLFHLLFDLSHLTIDLFHLIIAVLGETRQLLHLISEVLGVLFMENVNRNEIENIYTENRIKTKDELVKAALLFLHI